jgi:methyl-accepting chemotaxis protein
MNSKNVIARNPSVKSLAAESFSEGKSSGLMRRTFRRIWQSSIEIFKFLPIRFKLSLIIGTIVLIVVGIFSLMVLHSQKKALMKRMNQVTNVLIQNLAESVKGRLLLEGKEQILEYVVSLQTRGIEGLKQVAVLDRRGDIVASSARDGEEVVIQNTVEILKFDKLTVIEKRKTFEYYYPIELRETLLGIAFISFSKKAILAPIERARDIAIGSALVIMVISVVGIYVIARTMANQIQLLSDGAREVGKGNLNVEISVKPMDE